MSDKNLLQLPHREVDLDTVSDLSDEDYKGLIAYARQFDDPKQEEWVAQIADARGEDVPPPSSAPNPTSGITMAGEDEEVPDGTVQEVLDWVGDDTTRASRALEEENTKDEPRSTLVEKLESMTQE